MGKLRKDDTPEGKAIWDAVDKASESCPICGHMAKRHNIKAHDANARADERAKVVRWLEERAVMEDATASKQEQQGRQIVCDQTAASWGRIALRHRHAAKVLREEAARIEKGGSDG
jgi:uncharacterized Zn finger protein (UPF0148 family)